MIARILLGLLLLATSATPLAAGEALQPGMMAPAITLETLDGRTIGTTGLPGARAVVLVFWATWSNKSPEVLERVDRLAATLGPQGLAVVSVNVEGPGPDAAALARVRAAAERLRPGTAVAVDRNLEAFHAFGVVAVPTLVLTRGDGTVLATLASYPVVGREEFFAAGEPAVTGRGRPPAPAPDAAAPAARAVRLFNLGRTMAARGLLDQAMANLRLAIKADPGFALPRVTLGQLARERAAAHHAVRAGGQGVDTLRMIDGERERLLAEAEAALTEAVRLAPASAAALTELALVHRQRRDDAGARPFLERAIAADPAYSPGRAAYGALLLDSGDVARGRAEMDAAIQANPLDHRLYVMAAEALERRGLARDAAAAYRRGVELLWQGRRQGTP